ncbi:type II secretion system F family protein [Sandaracinobacter sp. RS1-74]|uniref:type II secretion system F family protein n=1 Tax=Sandaracinobacteroides sayramensis TaxID=2913411 RepID=UPI001EDBDE2E|nr:type II secretion system F family protein [Sandaracinobacteroides sayramensis]
MKPPAPARPTPARPAPAGTAKPADLPFWKRPIHFGKGGISLGSGNGPAAAGGIPKLGAQARSTLIRQLATLTAVMPVTDAVATLARQPGREAERQVLQRTNRALQAGSPLAASLPPSVFPAEVRSTIAAGEASGRLPLLLNRLADTMEAQVALRSRLISTLAYPLLLLMVAIGVILAMLLFVVPGIAEQLTGSGQTLPLLTRIVLALSGFVQSWWWLLLAVPLVAGLGLYLWLKRPGNRQRFDRALLDLPGIGGWLSALEAVRWSRLLATMLSAGLPLAEAMHITAPTLSNSAWREATNRMTQQVRAGSSLSATLGLLPNPPGLLVSLVQSGESSGRLAPLLESAASSLDRQLSDRSRTILALAEPAIIVVLGGLVGLIILAVLLPILELNTLAGAGIGAP